MGRRELPRQWAVTGGGRGPWQAVGRALATAWPVLTVQRTQEPGGRHILLELGC